MKLKKIQILNSLLFFQTIGCQDRDSSTDCGQILISNIQDLCEEEVNEKNLHFFECINNSVLDCGKASSCLRSLDICDLNPISNCINEYAYCYPQSCPVVTIDCQDSIYFDADAGIYEFDEAWDDCVFMDALTYIGSGQAEISACFKGNCVAEEDLVRMMCVE